jgi:hypothetical protein
MTDITANGPVQVANFQIQCPDCGVSVTIGVLAQLNETDLRELVLIPDVTDVWAHSWVHWQEPTAEK